MLKKKTKHGPDSYRLNGCSYLFLLVLYSYFRHCASVASLVSGLCRKGTVTLKGSTQKWQMNERKITLS